ncbi:hypothetical protein HHI36_003088 [Cryptolaemus montrouzieri]|uniref:Uncharacterized protein n=1 Tax=Cryptolaemus montrouzieri TaxID=559131 RepID=A0ABD2PCX3_9CUCU
MVIESVQWEKEEFSDNIELTEEQQIKILEEYEKETKNKSAPSNKNVSKKKISNTSTPANSPIKQVGGKTNIGISNKVDSASGLDNASSSSSIDEEWEKVTDVDK